MAVRNFSKYSFGSNRPSKQISDDT